ncbi:MAG: RNA polymerase sigma factor [Bacteroidota bacterium]
MLISDRMTDQQLVEGCRQGDRCAQRQLFEQYQRPMYSTIYRITNDEDDAHDVLQEGFIQVFKDIKQFRGIGALGGWIKTIMVRKALRKIQHEKRYEPLLPDSDITPVVWPTDLSGEVLDQAIREIPARCRAVFLLIEVEGYAHREVADMLSISEGTSKSQLHYAKQLLRTKLKSWYS